MARKLVLFDIDETLIYSDGAGRRAIGSALMNMFGVKTESIKVSMSGKTDQQILCEIMTAGGYGRDHYEERLEEWFECYLNILKEEILHADPFKVHEGVYDLLNELDQNQQASLGLLTGNIEKGARLKLDKFDLNRYFPIGAYGSDAFDRLDLPQIAWQRAKDYYKHNFAPEQMVIVGDSIHDIRCAKNYGAVSIAINTGKTTRQELEALSPDFLFPSLKDVKGVMDAIMN
ncbi:MAG: hydrolase [Candidatus Melainabacteria bacterium]|nr:MAG: hydrolase [Candidatus Melainabacteria bacterium]